MDSNQKQPGPQNAEKKAPRKGGRGPSKADLQVALTETRQRLRELTDQSLGFLEDLGEARRVAKEQSDLQRRVEQMEQLLADARRRLRGAGGAVLRAAPDVGARELEVVVWGGIPDPEMLAATVAALDGHGITCLISPDDEPPADAPAAVQWFSTADLRTPAQTWNTALAATEAAAVLFLHCRAVPGPGDWIDLPAADDSVALIQPVICRDGERFLGRQADDETLRAMHSVPQEGTGIVQVEHADPEAFVVVRRAVEELGLFDEDVLGTHALIEYGLRAPERGFRIVGWPALEIQGSAEPPREDAAIRDQDRLMILARHRPRTMGSAWTEAEFLHAMDRNALLVFFRLICQRLPDSAQWPEGLDLVALVAQGAVVHSMSPSSLAARLRPLCDGQLEQIDSARESVLDDMASVVAAARRSTAPPLERIEEVLAVETQARGRLLAELATLRQTLAGRDGEIALCNDRLAAAGREIQDRDQKLAAQQQELLERAAAIADRDQLLQTRDRQLAERDAQLQAQGALLQERDSQLAALAAEIQERDDVLATRDGQLAARERELAAERAQRELVAEQSASLQQELANATREIEATLGQRDHLRAESEKLQGMLGETGEADPASLVRNFLALREVLVLRERWIALLLKELGKRRLFPRKLQPHEEDLVARYDEHESA